MRRDAALYCLRLIFSPFWSTPSTRSLRERLVFTRFLSLHERRRQRHKAVGQAEEQEPRCTYSDYHCHKNGAVSVLGCAGHRHHVYTEGDRCYGLKNSVLQSPADFATFQFHFPLHSCSPYLAISYLSFLSELYCAI